MNMDKNETRALISVETFCVSHNITSEFILELKSYGLLDIITEEQRSFIDEESLEHLEKMIRLYYDLGINMEGIEVIGHMLERIDTLSRELHGIKSRLRLYEE